MNDKQAAREAAIRQAHDDYSRDGHLSAAMMKVFDAGFAAASQWVPVEERQPPSGQYFVTCFAGFVVEAYYTDRWYLTEDDTEMNAERFNEVIAWMPLPQPFRSE